MRKVLSIIVLVVGIGWGQNQPQNIQLAAPSPSGRTNVTLTRVGQGGVGSYYYWVVSTFPIGQGGTVARAYTTSAPNVFDGTHYIRVNWDAVPGATRYDVLRTTTSNMPNTCATCVRAANLSATTTTFNDNSPGAGTSFTYAPAPNATANLFLNNSAWAYPKLTVDRPFDMLPMGTYTVATLPTAAANPGRLAVVSDGNSGADCTTGTGGNYVLCLSSGSGWNPSASTGSGGSMTWPGTAGLAVYSGSNTWGAPATSANIVNLFSGCSGTQYLGADGACHVPSGGGGGTPGGSVGQLQYNNSGAFGGVTVSGDGTLNTGTGALSVTKIGGNTPGGSCSNQVVTSLNTSAVPTCTTLTSAYVNNSIALTGTDINNINQVTVTHLSSPLPASQGGNGVANTATHTLGTSNQNWATLGTGIVKNTTTTGAISNAASSDVIGLFSGSCTGSTFLAGNGACVTPAGGGNVSTSGSPVLNQISFFSSGTTVTGIGSDSTTTHALFATAGAPAFRAIVGSDIPTLNQSTSGTAAGLSSILVASSGGTGVNNSATLTLGSVNHNYATLGTGIVKNTTTTGAFTNAASSDVIGLFSGCSGVQYLGADGNCHATGVGSVSVVGSGSLTSTALVTGGGTTLIQTPSATATMDSSGNINTPGLITAVGGFSGGSGVAALLSGAEEAAPTVTTPSLYFNSTAHLPQYLNASSALVGSMILPASSRTANQFMTHINTNGAPQTAAIVQADLPATSTQTIANGVVHLGTTLVGTGTCTSTITVTATGALSTDVIAATVNGDPTSITGYTPATTGSLYVWAWPTAGNVNFKLCNNTASDITPSSDVVANWRIIR